MRTFIAIDLGSEIKERLSLLIENLNKLSQNVRWVNHEGMHLTLKFLGEIDPERVRPVENVLKDITEQYHPFPLRLKGTGWFPPGKKNPRVFWVGIETETSLLSLQSQLENSLEKLGFPKEERDFHPHLTLGRVKMPSGLHQILSELEKQKETHYGEMTVCKVTFYQSMLKPSGAEYKVLSEFELK
jgi:2'-5' RNA ligase